MVREIELTGDNQIYVITFAKPGVEHEKMLKDENGLTTRKELLFSCWLESQ